MDWGAAFDIFGVLFAVYFAPLLLVAIAIPMLWVWIKADSAVDRFFEHNDLPYLIKDPDRRKAALARQSRVSESTESTPLARRAG